MMQKPSNLMLLIAFALCCPSVVRAGGIDVLAWQLSTRVDNFVDRETASTITLQNPYQTTQMVSLGQSTATSIYDVAWNAQQMTFLMDAVHETIDVISSHSSFSRSAGDLRFRSDQPMLVTFDLEYDYNIPGSTFQSSAIFGVGAVGIGNLVNVSHSGGPLDLEPAVGSFSTQGSVEVPPDTEALFSYSLRIRTVGGGSNVIGRAGGHLYLTIETIPEPATFFLLVAVSPCVIIRRRTGLKGRSMGAPGKWRSRSDRNAARGIDRPPRVRVL